MKVKIKKIISARLFITIIVFALGIYYLVKNKEDFSTIDFSNPILFVPIIVLTIIFYADNGYQGFILLKTFDVTLKKIEWFGLSIIATMWGLLLPFRGGLLSNAVYLKKLYGFSYKKFLMFTLGLYIIIYWINSLLGIVFMLLTRFIDNSFSIEIFLFYIISFLFLSYLIFFPKEITWAKFRLVGKYNQVIRSWIKLRSQKKVLVKLVLLNIINLILISIIMQLEFISLDLSYSFIKIVSINIFAAFSLLISMTPGGLGIKEVSAGFIGNSLGIPLNHIILVSLIDRLINFVITIVLGIYFSNKLGTGKK